MSELTNKLYRITLKGMTYSASGTAYGIPYVIAKDPNEALKKVQDYLNKRNLGFCDSRELDKITLLAEESDYPGCHTQLFL